MNYQILNNKIIIKDLSQFNTQQIFDCGQIFRYYINDDIAEVVSMDKYAQVFTFTDRVEIVTQEVEYFVHFFDLNNDYNNIKNKLSNDAFLAPAIKFGYGIRILNQNLFEMIVSFIISANNNIKRIKNSLNYLSKKFGTKQICKIDGLVGVDNSQISEQIDDSIVFYSFPTLEQLKCATVEDYVSAGLGYRAQYMYDTIQKLTEKDLSEFKELDANQQLEWLLSLKGVGEKVANCIMLFALHQTDCFPVDTWINKVYNDLTNTHTTNRKAISRELTSKYGDLSGYAQQYFFYYYRSK
jgi:N-glycosylase/DNA lyase